jgi:hypothetical protein
MGMRSAPGVRQRPSGAGRAGEGRKIDAARAARQGRVHSARPRFGIVDDDAACAVYGESTAMPEAWLGVQPGDDARPQENSPMNAPQDPGSVLEPAWLPTLGHAASSQAEGSRGAAAPGRVRTTRPKPAALAAASLALALTQALAQQPIALDGAAQAPCQLPGRLDVFNPMFDMLEP